MFKDIETFQQEREKWNEKVKTLKEAAEELLACAKKESVRSKLRRTIGWCDYYLENMTEPMGPPKEGQHD